MNGFLLRVCGAVAGLVFGMSSTLEAAPVTFAFEAEVRSLSTGIPFDTGIDVAVGDTIAGSFTFTPDPGDGSDSLDATQSDDAATFVVDGKTFATTTVGEGIRFMVFNNATVLDGPVTTLDTIRFGGVFDQLPAGTTMGIARGGWTIDIGAFPALEVNSDGFLVDADFPLPSAMLPSDIAAWNFMASRPGDIFGPQLSISLRSNDGGAVGINARLGEFILVPEPSAIGLVFPIAGYLLNLLRGRK